MRCETRARRPGCEPATTRARRHPTRRYFSLASSRDVSYNFRRVRSIAPAPVQAHRGPRGRPARARRRGRRRGQPHRGAARPHPGHPRQAGLPAGAHDRTLGRRPTPHPPTPRHHAAHLQSRPAHPRRAVPPRAPRHNDHYARPRTHAARIHKAAERHTDGPLSASLPLCESVLRAPTPRARKPPLAPSLVSNPLSTFAESRPFHYVIATIKESPRIATLTRAP